MHTWNNKKRSELQKKEGRGFTCSAEGSSCSEASSGQRRRRSSISSWGRSGRYRRRDIRGGQPRFDEAPNRALLGYLPRRSIRLVRHRILLPSQHCGRSLVPRGTRDLLRRAARRVHQAKARPDRRGRGRGASSKFKKERFVRGAWVLSRFDFRGASSRGLVLSGRIFLTGGCILGTCRC